MEVFRKYSSLPDVDGAPDVYESVPSVSLPAAARPRSPSEGSSDSDSINEDKSSVNRRKIQPSQARKLFASTNVDATNVDFSDQIVHRRKAYRVRSEKRTWRGNPNSSTQTELGDEEPETMDGRIARLLREVEEVQGAFEVTQNSHANGDATVNYDTNQVMATVLELNGVLKEIQISSRLQHSKSTTSTIDLSVDSSDVQHTTHPAQLEVEIRNHAQSQAQGSTTPLLAKAIALESRLSTLENAIGSSHALIMQGTQLDDAKSLLTSISLLEAQFDSISTINNQSLEALSSQIMALTQDATRLEEARNAATQAAHEALKAKSLGIQPTSNSGNILNGAAVVAPENLELVAKIDALYASLPTIENTAPLLPGVIERLRSLRVLHADAATSEQRLTEVEQRQSKIGSELTAWREGLHRVEQAMKENDKTSKSNMMTIQSWVRKLEQHMEASR